MNRSWPAKWTTASASDELMNFHLTVEHSMAIKRARQLACRVRVFSIVP
jgi:hypothetical protein